MATFFYKNLLIRGFFLLYIYIYIYIFITIFSIIVHDTQWIQELPCTLSLKEIEFLMIQLEVLSVVTHLVDEYQTTGPAGMCREQYEQGLSNTIDSKDGGLNGAPVNIWWISWSEHAQAYWYFMLSLSSCPLPLSSQTIAMSRFKDLPFFILNSRACTEVNNSFAGLLMVIVVNSYALHAPYIFLWKVCVE